MKIAVILLAVNLCLLTGCLTPAVVGQNLQMAKSGNKAVMNEIIKLELMSELENISFVDIKAHNKAVGKCIDAAIKYEGAEDVVVNYTPENAGAVSDDLLTKAEGKAFLMDLWNSFKKTMPVPQVPWVEIIGVVLAALGTAKGAQVGGKVVAGKINGNGKKKKT